MVYEGRVVGTLTGQDVDKMKDRLFKTYFHLPQQPTVKKSKRRRRRR